MTFGAAPKTPLPMHRAANVVDFLIKEYNNNNNNNNNNVTCIAQIRQDRKYATTCQRQTGMFSVDFRISPEII